MKFTFKIQEPLSVQLCLASFCTNFVSMLVIETILIYLIVFTLSLQKCCVQTMLSMLASTFFNKKFFVLTLVLVYT